MNILADFPADQFRILGVCESCGRTGWVDRSNLPDNLPLDTLRAHVICRTCGSRDCGIRLVYAGCGEFSYGSDGAAT